jgi:Tfp pilus assembly protein PilO
MLTDKIVKCSSTSKIVVSVSFVAIVTLATYNWIVSPQTGYLHAARQYEMIVGNAGKKTTFIKDQISTKEVEIEELQREIAEIQNSFFSSQKATEFFMDIEPLSLQCNCNVDSLTFMADETHHGTDEDKSSPVILRHAAVDITGTYEDLMKFLGRLGNYPQRIAISDLRIESGPRDSDKLTCGMTITIYIVEDKEIITDEQT